jgi:hypothetical protein
MLAIHDSLDGQVDETEYTNSSIGELFDVIEKDKITPEERACMKDEYNEENAKKQAIREEKEKMARNFKAFGTLTDEQIASATGLSLEIVKGL